jgi:hypothetical protein
MILTHRDFGHAYITDAWAVRFLPERCPGRRRSLRRARPESSPPRTQAFWQEARKVNGDAAGTRELIEVLLLHRSMRAADVIAGIKAALSVGAVTADVVAVEARLHSSGAHIAPTSRRPRTCPQAAGCQSHPASAARSSGRDRGPPAGSASVADGHAIRRAPATPQLAPCNHGERRDNRYMSTRTAVTTTLRRQRGMSEEAPAAAVDQACRRLRLPTVRAVMDEPIRVAEQEQLSYQGFLAELLLAECDDRDRRSTVRRVAGAGFPRQKWLGDFDYDANPNINPATIHTHATGDWVRRGDPLCLIGDSGTGK